MDKDIKDNAIIAMIALGWLIVSAIVYNYNKHVGYLLLVFLVLAFITGFSARTNSEKKHG